MPTVEAPLVLDFFTPGEGVYPAAFDFTLPQGGAAQNSGLGLEPAKLWLIGGLGVAALYVLLKPSGSRRR